MGPGRTLLITLVVLAGLGGLLAVRGAWGDGTGDHLDIALVGDSFLEQSHAQFGDLTEDQGLSTDSWAYGGTSICSWWDPLEDLAADPPAVLVLSFAGNDQDSCIDNGEPRPRDPADVAADYRAHLERVVDMFAGSGTELYVVPPPPIGRADFDANAQAMRDMYDDAAPELDLTVIDSVGWLDPDGTGFHETLPCEPWDDCPTGEDEIVVREDDRIHLTPAGGERYARAILEGVASSAAIDLSPDTATAGELN